MRCTLTNDYYILRVILNTVQVLYGVLYTYEFNLYSSRRVPPVRYEQV